VSFKNKKTPPKIDKFVKNLSKSLKKMTLKCKNYIKKAPKWPKIKNSPGEVSKN
jgi:hypothetical protein